MSGPRSARAAAAVAVDRILRSGAYSNVLVAATEIDPPRDHGLHQRLVYTVLRHLPTIDRAIADASSRPLDRIDPGVLAVCRVGVAEIVHLRSPDHAAVDRAVAATREIGHTRSAGFVNAVLRAVATDPPPADAVDPRVDYPRPVVDAVESALGVDGATAFLSASNRPAPIGVRYRSGTGTGTAPAAYLPDGAAPSDIDEDVDVMDPASATVVSAVGATAGATVLDLAAAPGGKTRAIAERVGHDGLVVASDVHPRRVRDARRRCAGLDRVRWVVADAAQPPFRSAAFDAVLLDAPCTGLGVLRRRPEIRYRFDAAAPARYGDLQRRLVEAALDLVRPGGRLVYSVCTVTPAETVEVVDGLGFSPPPIDIGRVYGDGRLLAPHLDGTDGMYIAIRDLGG